GERDFISLQQGIRALAGNAILKSGNGALVENDRRFRAFGPQRLAHGQRSLALLRGAFESRQLRDDHGVAGHLLEDEMTAIAPRIDPGAGRTEGERIRLLANATADGDHTDILRIPGWKQVLLARE